MGSFFMPILANIKLETLDLSIIFGFFAVAIGIGIYTSRSAGKSEEDFFLGGRSMPWWLLGFSMVATTFSTDTPNFVTDIIRKDGVASNWMWWAFLLTGMLTVFVYAQLWRRSGVTTDVEFYEMRYSGKSAAFLRGFRGIYLGVLFNIIIMGMVSLAAIKIGDIMLGLNKYEVIGYSALVTVIFSALGGFKGVLLTDFLLFIIAMVGSVGAAYYALDHQAVGGLSGMLEYFRDPIDMAVQQGVDIDGLLATLTQQKAQLAGITDLENIPRALEITTNSPEFKQALATKLNMTTEAFQIQEVRASKLDIFPSPSNQDLFIGSFVIVLAVQWWAAYFPGAEPGGGGYLVQRMLAAKNEKHALGATLFFNFAHYALRPWPWIIVALCSMIAFPDLADIKAAFPYADESKIANDTAYSAMLAKTLPVGWMGLVLTSLVAAYMSTISTHLNWGSSYIVNDIYMRFMKPDATAKEQVWVGRISTVVLMVATALVAFWMKSASQVFNIVIMMGAGTGGLLIIRWFWWRVNAMSEIVAMVVSFFTAIALNSDAEFITKFFTYAGASFVGVTVLIGSIGLVLTFYNFSSEDKNKQLLAAQTTIWKTTAICATAAFYFLAVPECFAFDGSMKIVLGVAVTTVAWVMTAFIAPSTDKETLRSFVELVNPAGPGWKKVQADAEAEGNPLKPKHVADNLPTGILCMVLGSAGVYSLLFAIGYAIYGQTTKAIVLAVISVVATIVLFSIWTKANSASSQESNS